MIQNKYRELGNVNWERNYQTALDKSKASSKPILLLFQEVPGCSTCVNFGIDSLSFPLMVEAIENEFIPLFIQNNKDGEDARILKMFNEPSWNNPVVYFLNHNGESIIPKLSNNYHPLSLYYKMIETLNKLGKNIPGYIKVLERDLKINNNQNITTYYETPCFWSGETSLIQQHGVLSTEAGWMGNKEVVKIDYDPNLVSKSEMDDFAINQGFFKLDTLDKYTIDKEPQYYLSNSSFSAVPLSSAQKSLINYFIPYKANDPKDVLSPKQLQWHNAFGKLKSIMYKTDFQNAWLELERKENGTPSHAKTTP